MRSHLADNMFPRITSPVARFMIGRRVPRVKILLVHLAKNPKSRADVAATWHSLLVTMSSLLVTIVIFGHYIGLLLCVPWPPAPERTLSTSGRLGCARGFFMRAGRPGPASYYYNPSLRLSIRGGYYLWKQTLASKFSSLQERGVRSLQERIASVRCVVCLNDRGLWTHWGENNGKETRQLISVGTIWNWQPRQIAQRNC